jgi:hypothetical protein
MPAPVPSPQRGSASFRDTRSVAPPPVANVVKAPAVKKIATPAPAPVPMDESGMYIDVDALSRQQSERRRPAAPATGNNDIILSRDSDLYVEVSTLRCFYTYYYIYRYKISTAFFRFSFSFRFATFFV